jgi:dephospho-CoA kinase
LKKYKLIGLTGQTGAGKSTVARVFADCGASVINADEIVARLYSAGSPCVRTIAACFGDQVLTEGGEIDRRALAQTAFASAESTALLGKIVHPFVTAAFFEWLKGKSGTVVYDAPQLFEANADVICDCVVAVTADKSRRMQRIMKRDGLTEAQAMQRINAQHSEAFFSENSDFCIENNGDEATLREKSALLYKKIASR